MTNEHLPKPHKHAALIKQWVDDPSVPVWIWAPCLSEWVTPYYPHWGESSIYALGEKPTSPPKRMCVLAGVEFPAPETEAPTIGGYYWIPQVTYRADAIKCASCKDANDQYRLDAGLVHLTKEAAQQHAKALLAANKESIK